MVANVTSRRPQSFDPSAILALLLLRAKVHVPGLVEIRHVSEQGLGPIDDDVDYALVWDEMGW